MARKLWTATAFLALLVVVGKYYAKPVLAQVRAALVQSTDEPGRHVFGFQFYSAVPSISVPSDRRYVVDQYTAQCSDPGTAMTILSIESSAGGTGVFSTAPPPHYVRSEGGSVNVYVTTGSGPIYADPGTSIRLGTNVSDSSCDYFVSGHYILQP